ncbi:response regulator transcription factor [Paraburkholderia sp. 22099]|jgi:DNA-binding response OmpR family regulator|uniref:DNA-binding response OmpR family regulator n=1 Tax=Paraburkholderia terricola TaxID=169427 RepID=A0ABU1LU37_9BURK|nr:response regulator transcription factor [Paraburkholderia terricola]MDR6410287.1 DNA-binding response OmpR family regulator [Paraburkholderia terricola]MDR6444161.1 DNA-binding response OmpR family regulator [Paraburkholderia terricola]MDR6481447.1 DNA-binding response OmpR family regulator [Paraburkholderia terricola]MDR6491767.1 DNA-binding response OmpR family regulator [Paraburkholderia terricola]
MRFALVTEDPLLTRDLAGCFAADSIAVESFDGELPLVRAMRATAYDLVLIDAKNGSLLLDSLLSWRNCNATACTPVIVLTPFPNWTAMLGWINAGATDVAYRFDLEQTRLRAHVVLQRENHRAGADTVTLGGYVLRRDLGVLTLDGVEIPLTPREFTMAWLFFSNPGKFVTRAQIAGGVWGSCEDVAARSIEQHIYKLRKKLRLSPESGLNLKTVYALGYKLDCVAPVGESTDALARVAQPA